MDVPAAHHLPLSGMLEHYNEYDYVIVNDDFDESLLNMRSIILSNRQKTDKQEHYITEKFNL